MITLLAKELRLIGAAWLAAMVLAIVPSWIGDGNSMLVTSCFGMGAVLIALAPFLQEFNYRTFSVLLVEPRSRAQIFWVKTGAAGAGLLVAWLAFYISWGLRANLSALWAPGINALLALVALGGGLWTAVALRQFVASYFAMMIAPAALLQAFAYLAPLWSKNPIALTALGIAYSFAGVWWARWLFVRAQDVPWTGGSVSLASSREGGRRVLGFPRPLHPLAALAQKELQLQHMTLLAGFCLVALTAAVAVVMRMMPPPKPTAIYPAVVVSLLGLMWMLLGVSIGGAAMAEERRLGTVQDLVCLPVSRRWTFAVKFGMTLLLEALWSIAVVWIPALVRASEFGNYKDAVETAGAAFLFLSIIPFYASTVSRTLFHAQAIGSVLLIGALTFFSGASELSPLLAYVGGPVLWLTLLALSWWNYRDAALNKSVWRGNLAGLAAGLALALAVFSGIHYRCWEWLTDPEPKHGAPRMAASSAPAVREGSRGVFALLPDGRLWLAEDFDILAKESISWNRTTDCVVRPTSGRFLSESNWVDISGGVALRGDGSLWNITLAGLPTNIVLDPTARPDMSATPSVGVLHVTPKLERIGMDSDWASVKLGMLLKKDGTIWALPDMVPEFGPSLTNEGREPIQVSSASDWLRLGFSRIAAKKDGSLSRWSPEKGKLDHWLSAPLKDSPAQGTSWTSIGWISLRSDGTLWNANIYGGHPSISRIGTKSDCRALAGYALLRKDGKLVSAVPYYDFWRPANPFAAWVKAALYRFSVSRYSDWITAVDAPNDSILALASDGTLCSWNFREYDRSTVPSRRPQWSLNIFAAETAPSKSN